MESFPKESRFSQKLCCRECSVYPLLLFSHFIEVELSTTTFDSSMQNQASPQVSTMLAKMKHPPHYNLHQALDLSDPTYA